MQMTVDIPEKVVERAAALGVSVESLISTAIDSLSGEPLPEGFIRLGASTRSRAEAAASIREIQSRNSLGGLSLKDLINEGRRF